MPASTWEEDILVWYCNAFDGKLLEFEVSEMLRGQDERMFLAKLRHARGISGTYPASDTARYQRHYGRRRGIAILGAHSGGIDSPGHRESI